MKETNSLYSNSRYTIDNEQLLQDLKHFFSINEWVDQSTYQAYGEKSWRFFDKRLLATLLYVREQIGQPITINTWSRGGQFSQRGLRTNLSPLVIKKSSKQRLYLSAHMRGSAVDFDVKGYSAMEVREWLIQKQSELPYKIRLESKMNGKEISWVHLDVDDEPANPKVYLFNV